MATFIKSITVSHGLITAVVADHPASGDLAASGVTPGSYNQVTVNSAGIVTAGSNVSYLTANQTITLSGDASGSGTTAITLTIGAGAVTYAKMQNVTAGRLLGNPTGSAAAPSEISIGSGLSLSTGGVLTSTATSDTNPWKPLVQAVATSNIASLSGTTTVDGVSLTAGYIVLLTNQTTGSQNGPWVVSSGSWARPSWFASGNTTQAFAGVILESMFGTVYAGSQWRITTGGIITVDTTGTTWTEIQTNVGYAAGILPVANGGTGTTAFTQYLLVAGAGPGFVQIVNGAAGTLLISQGVAAYPIFVAVSGDLGINGSGTATVKGLQGFAIKNATPTNAQVLVWNNTNADWEPVSLSGDFGITNAGVATLANSGVTAGTYGQVTVDAKGRVTAGATTDVGHGGTGATSLTGYVKGNGTSPMTAAATVPATDLGALNTLTANDAALGDLLPFYHAGNGSLSVDRLGGFLHPLLWDFRLSLVDGDPYPVADQSAKSTVYLTPAVNAAGATRTGKARLCLYDGTRWLLYATDQVTLPTLSGLTSGLPYDVFVWDNSGLTAEFVAWTNGTTRATALALQDGVLVKSGTATKRLAGTIYTTATTSTEDSAIKRFVSNAYNSRPRTLAKSSTSGHTYASATLRQWNNDAANKVEFVLCLPGAVGYQFSQNETPGTTGFYGDAGVGEDTVAGYNTESYSANAGQSIMGNGKVGVTFAAGYHYLAALESCPFSQSVTFNAFVLTGNVLN